MKQLLFVGTAPIRASAQVPSGITLTVTPPGQPTQQLSNGETLTIKTGVTKTLLAQKRLSKPATDNCGGGGAAGASSVSLAGGARHREVNVKLPNAHMALESVTPVPAREQGTYVVSDGHMTRHGRDYTFVLDTLTSDPRGSHLVLRFKRVGSG